MATYFEPPIQRVVVEAFRGFRDRQEFDIGASAVVLAGPNGTGKTSFFDALQWCFLGTIDRLEGLRARRNVEHIVNQYRLGARASVAVEMRIGGQFITIRRSGDQSGSTLEFNEAGSRALFGQDAQVALEEALVPGDGLTLEMALTTSGLMQQDVMRAVLQAKPADRYRHISTVLGLGALEDFEEAARELARHAKSQADAARTERAAAAEALEQAQERLATAEQRLQALPRIEVLRADVQVLLDQGPGSAVIADRMSLADSNEMRALAVAAGNLIQQLESYSAAMRSTQAAGASLPPEPSADTMQAAEASVQASRSAVEAARATVADAQARLDAAKAATEDLAQLAALAIPMLTADCPVCGQAIEPARVEEELRARAADTGTILSLQRTVDEARRVLVAAQTKAQEAQNAAADLASLDKRWQAYRVQAERTARAANSLLTETGLIRIQVTDADELARRLPDILEFLQSLRRRVLEVLDGLERGVDRGQVERATSEIASFSEVLAAKSRRLEAASQRALVLKGLADASVAARVEVTESRFSAIQPLVADIFSRLDPHPAFKTIEFELDTYYRKGTTTPLVRDLVEGVTADPLLVFSTSQANIAALSYFLAMGWSAGERNLPFVMLDDPVQSMDDVNVLGFADLCRHLRSARQLIISTHERRFARLLERKLAPRQEASTTRVLEFVGWDRSGPIIESRTVESQLVDDPIRIVQAAS